MRRGLATVGGNAAYSATQLVLLIAIAQYTSPGDVGLYALSLAISAPIQLGIGLRLRTAFVVLSAQNVSPLNYYHLALVTGAVATTLSGIVGLFVATTPKFLLCILLVALSKAVEGQIDMTYGVLQRADHLGRIAVSQVARGVATTGIVIAVLAIWENLVLALTALLATWLLQLAALDLPRAKPLLGDPLPRSELKTMAWLARRTFPLGLGACIISLLGMLPRYNLMLFENTESVGVFSVLSYSAVVMSLFANAVCQAHLLPLTQAFETSDWGSYIKQVAKLFLTLSTIGILGIVIFWIWGESILRIAFGDEYAAAVSTGLVLLGAAITSAYSTISYYVLVSCGSFRSHLYVSVAVLAVAIPVGIALTLKWGMNGAASAVIVSNCIQTLLSSFAATASIRANRSHQIAVSPS